MFKDLARKSVMPGEFYYYASPTVLEPLRLNPADNSVGKVLNKVLKQCSESVWLLREG